jgi:bifunctional ADP-heptose synthase (sugar kinase/adenylyltransferase)
VKLVVVGENIKDVFVSGSVTRVSPEAPNLVFQPKGQTTNRGGAGNVVENLSSLGKDLEVIPIYSEEITKTRYVDEVSHYILFRVDENDIVHRMTNLTLRICDVIDRFKPDGILISDYCKNFLWDDDIRQISCLAADKGIPIFLDTKKVLGKWSEEISFVKINKKEYDINVVTLGHSPTCFCRNLIVTLGKSGSVCKNLGINAKSPEMTVKTRVGLGDSFFGSFALSYLGNFGEKYKGSIQKSMELANIASSLAGQSKTIARVSREELIKNIDI